MIWLSALIFPLSNWLLRGGGLKRWMPLKGGRIIHALICGLMAYLITDLPWYGVSFAVAMFLGSMPALFHTDSDYALYARKWPLWSWVVFKRGLVWSAPLVTASMLFFGLSGLWYILPAVLMPLCYSFVWMKTFSIGPINNWTASEIAFGLALGLPLM